MDKPTSLEDWVSIIKARNEPVKPSKRRWKRAPTTPKGGRSEARKASQRAFWRTPSGQWKHLVKTYKARAKKRGEESKWKISLEEWLRLWTAAGTMKMQGGAEVSYLTLRGKSKDSVKLWRIDENLDWVLGNVVVLYKGQVIANGRKILTEEAGKAL